MLLLIIRLPGQRRQRRELNNRPNKPPFRKPERAQEQRSIEHINQIQTNVRYHNIRQIYHLERRFLP